MPAPKLKPGEKDGRVNSGRNELPEGEAKDVKLDVRLKPHVKQWVMDRGGSAWVRDLIEAEMRKAR